MTNNNLFCYGLEIDGCISDENSKVSRWNSR